jgi:Cysteine-rich secretory protein family
MRILRCGAIGGLVLVFAACGWNALGQEMPAKSQTLPAVAQQLFAMANESRAEAGAGRLVWDPALAQAAMQHCLRMTEEDSLSHQYRGEADLATRANTAGARFGLIEENIALGSRVAGIHEGWLESPGHRANLLNLEVNRIGVAVIASQGVIFAVEDFSRGVPALTAVQVEGTVAGLIRAERVPVSQDARDARAACTMDSGVPASADPRPRFIFRWQGAELTSLPPELVRMLASKEYRRAAVGNCPPAGGQGQFTTYRMAVLLY